eukprot:jgi/Hompol1/5492/HPOL_000194-RA
MLLLNLMAMHSLMDTSKPVQHNLFRLGNSEHHRHQYLYPISNLSRPAPAYRPKPILPPTHPIVSILTKPDRDPASKKTKSVRFKPDDLLRETRLFVVDHSDEDGDGDDSMGEDIGMFAVGDRTHPLSARDFDRSEGQEAFRKRREELVAMVPWDVPRPIYIADLDDSFPASAGVNSKEAKIQEERERSALSQIYYNIRDIPPSPFEPDEPPYRNRRCLAV